METTTHKIKTSFLNTLRNMSTREGINIPCNSGGVITILKNRKGIFTMMHSHTDAVCKTDLNTLQTLLHKAI